MKPGLGTGLSSLGSMTVEPYDRTMSAHPTLFEDIDSMEPDRFGAPPEQWNNGPATIVEANVTYTRKDGSTSTLPVVAIYRAAGELIDGYRMFMDVAPLLAS